MKDSTLNTVIAFAILAGFWLYVARANAAANTPTDFGVTPGPGQSW